MVLGLLRCSQKVAYVRDALQGVCAPVSHPSAAALAHSGGGQGARADEACLRQPYGLWDQCMLFSRGKEERADKDGSHNLR